LSVTRLTFIQQYRDSSQISQHMYALFLNSFDMIAFSDVPFPERLNFDKVEITIKKIQNATDPELAGRGTLEHPPGTQPSLRKTDSQQRDAPPADERSNHDLTMAAPYSVPPQTTVSIPALDIPQPREPFPSHQPKNYPPGSIAFILLQNEQNSSHPRKSSFTSGKADGYAKGDGSNKRRTGDEEAIERDPSNGTEINTCRTSFVIVRIVYCNSCIAYITGDHQIMCKSLKEYGSIISCLVIDRAE
ncbi:hypothetical protein KCU89_g58, partial [Aureobasidium melanogenum]